MKHPIRVLIFLLAGLLGPRPAGADLTCTLFGRCLYEGAPFRFTETE